VTRLDDRLATSDVAILLSFGLLLDGTSLEAVSRSLTGINGSSEGIVGVLVRGDTASALNISLGSVQVLAVQQINSRQLLVNVSAALPVTSQQEAAASASQDLSAGARCCAGVAGVAAAGLLLTFLGVLPSPPLCPDALLLPALCLPPRPPPAPPHATTNQKINSFSGSSMTPTPSCARRRRWAPSQRQCRTL
jgi:hypothetical protein